MDPIEESLRDFDDDRQLYNMANIYRATVVDTNDPLHNRRIKIRIPRFHDRSMPDEYCPWALSKEIVGGKGCGQWNNYCKGDIVFVSFENGDPWNPVIIGAADPTMLNFQPLESIYHDFKVLSKSPNSNKRDEKGLSARYKEFFYYNLADFLPKDRRPMSLGFKDRYGSSLSFNSIGYFPIEHIQAPRDDYNQTVFEKVKKSEAPQINQPDVKSVALVSKYGHYILLGDQGYYWKKKSQKEINKEKQELTNEGIDLEESEKGKDDGYGEFTGDFWEDYNYETERSIDLTRLFNEDIRDNQAGSEETPELGNYESHDQRRIELRTRYGHMIQMRDVGWNQTRIDEYQNESRKIVQNSQNVELWLKVKTKGGHLIELIDNGFDLENDTIINKPLRKENQQTIDGEKNFGTDARMIRFVTRGLSDNGAGSKIVLDDRITIGDITKKYNQGILLKSSRQLKGFGVELNDRDNHLQIYSPEKQCIEFDDDKQALTISAGLNKSQSKSYKGKTDNEFNTDKINWKGSFHIRLNAKDNYIKIKDINDSGIEINSEENKEWIDIREDDNRGVFASKADSVTAIRGENSIKYIALDDKQGTIIVYSDDKLQIYSEKKIEFYSKENIEFKSEQAIVFTGRRTTLEVSQDINSDGQFKGKGDYSPNGKISNRANFPQFTKPKLKPDQYHDN